MKRRKVIYAFPFPPAGTPEQLARRELNRRNRQARQDPQVEDALRLLSERGYHLPPGPIPLSDLAHSCPEEAATAQPNPFIQ